MNRDRAIRTKTVALKNGIRFIVGRIILVLFPLSFFLCPSCNPEATWTTKDVTIDVHVKNVSAGFIECDFATDKEAYYLVSCMPAQEGAAPLSQPKQFMMLALDSANREYIDWRNGLLKAGEFNIAPFSSHALQYGSVNYFFTGLMRDTDYWIFAFVVNPETMKPVGHLNLVAVHTKFRNEEAIHFEYRIKGYWDYAYPLDGKGNINSHYPYVAATRDSLQLDSLKISPKDYFGQWYDYLLAHPKEADIHYGVTAVENTGFDGTQLFEEGHTYYTTFCGFDGASEKPIVYGFTWKGDTTAYYFTELDQLQ